MTHDRNGGEEGHLDLLELDAVRAGEAPPEHVAHLEACPSCRRELERMMRACVDVRGLEPPRVEVPASVDEAILGAFRKASARRVIPFPAWRWAAPALGMAVAASLAWVLLVPGGPLAPTGPVTSKVPAAPGVAPSPELASTPAQAEAPVEAPAPARAKASPAPPLPGDVNGDGSVDILDAYRLAVLLEEKNPRAAGFDENADGAVDGKDVEELTTLAVALR